jgi:hypothetical protein
VLSLLPALSQSEVLWPPSPLEALAFEVELVPALEAL